MIVDGIILAVIFLSALIAFFRGFVREVLTLCGFAGALVVAFLSSPFLQPMAHEWLHADPEARFFNLIPHTVAIDVGVFAVVFLVTLILLNLLTYAVASGLHAVGLGAIDRTLGVVFGLARGVFLVSLFYLPFYFQSSAEQKKTWFAESATLPLVDLFITLVEPYFPRDEDNDKNAPNHEKPHESAGFDRLDDLMRTALEPGQEPEIIRDEPPTLQKGYTADENDIIGETIQDQQKDPQ